MTGQAFVDRRVPVGDLSYQARPGWIPAFAGMTRKSQAILSNGQIGRLYLLVLALTQIMLPNPPPLTVITSRPIGSKAARKW